MTAPDPGLVDLIAAHLVETVTPLDDVTIMVDCTCGQEIQFTYDDIRAAPVDSTAGSLQYMLREHVASIVEQHNKAQAARVAELEVLQRVDQDLFVQTLAIANQHKKRAEKAEAAVARVTAALEEAEKSEAASWGVAYIYTAPLRAALEGES